MVESRQLDFFQRPPKDSKEIEISRSETEIKFPTDKERSYIKFFRAGIFFDLPAKANVIVISNVAPEAPSSAQAHIERQAQRQINTLEQQRKKARQLKGQMRFNADDILNTVALKDVQGFPINKGKSNLPPVPENAKLYLIKDKSSQGGLIWYYGAEKPRGITELREFNVRGVQFFSPFRPPRKDKNGNLVKPAGELHHLIAELEEKQKNAEEYSRIAERKPVKKKKKKGRKR